MEKKENLMTRIESLWILEASSGICIFEENYVDFTKEGISSDLVASFLSALLSFAGEAFTDEIQHVKFSNRKIIFKFTEHVLFVISVSDKVSAEDVQIQRINNKIANRFIDKFQSIFKNDYWSNNVSQFNDFSEDLRKIVEKEPLKEKFIQDCFFKKQIKKVRKHLVEKKEKMCKRKEKLKNIILLKWQTKTT